MPKITSVEVQKNNTHRFNIFLDGQFAFGADEDLVVDQRLIVGKIIDPPLLEKLLFEAEVGKLMERMYALFNIRQRSEKEIRDYFRVKSQESRVKGKNQVSDLGIELVIKKLKQKNLLNDEVFAKSWVDARRRSKKKGIISLKSELYQKGIARDLIEKVLGETDKESEEVLATAALEKKMRVWENLPVLNFRKKAYDFLMRRGFEYDIVKSTVEKVTEKE